MIILGIKRKDFHLNSILSSLDVSQIKWKIIKACNDFLDTIRWNAHIFHNVLSIEE